MGSYGTGLKGATRSVIATLREDSRRDKAAAEAAEAAAAGGATQADESGPEPEPELDLPTSPEPPQDEVDLVKPQDVAAAEEAARKLEADKKAEQKKKAEKRAAQKKAADEKAADEKAAQKKAAQKAAAEEKVAQKAAQEKAAEEKAAKEKAAEDEKANLDRIRREVNEAVVAAENRLRETQESITSDGEERLREATDDTGDHSHDQEMTDAPAAEGDGEERYPWSEIWEGARGPRPRNLFGKRPSPEVTPAPLPKRTKVTGTPVPNLGNNAGSRPTSSGSVGNLTSTGRSFFEESGVFGGANVQTPATQTPAQSSAVDDTPTRTIFPNIARGARVNIPIPQVNTSSPSQPNPPSRFAGSTSRSSAAASSSMAATRQAATVLQREVASDRFAPRTQSQARPGTILTTNNARAGDQEGKNSTRLSPSQLFTTPLASSTSPPDHPADPVTSQRSTADPQTVVSHNRDGRPRGSRDPTDPGYPILKKRDSSATRQKGHRRRDSYESDTPEEPYTFQWYLGTAKRYLASPIGSVIRWLAYLSLTLLVLRLWYASGNPELQNARVHPTVGWYGWADWKHNIGQFVPYTLRHPLGCITDDEYNALKYFVDSQGDEIAKLAGASQVTSLATSKLESILPQAVWAKRDKSGRLVITQEFWHALKDFMRDESVLTLEGKKKGSQDISDDHWSALLKRFKDRGIPGHDENVKSIVQRSFSSSWESWLKNNNEKVNRILGHSPGKDLPAATQDQILSKAEKLIEERLSAKGLKDTVVSKGEFVREIETSLMVYKREIQAELLSLQDKLAHLAEKAAAASQAASGSAPGLTRSEVVTLTNDIVRKAIGDAQLKAAAKGSIGANFEAELNRRVNYFALGNGAVVDPVLTSVTFSPPREPLGSRSWLRSKPPKFQIEQLAALMSWEDAGQCWCAGSRDRNNATIPVSISVKLPRAIIPEDVVVEHIDPSATLDPEAMPKAVEVWAAADEYSRREVARNFMMTQYPGTPAAHPLLLRGFIKIGEFTYEHNAATKGVQVYKVSSEFAKMDFMTDQVLVRAVSNHGADHTCFYRVRLYGEPRDLEDTISTK